MSVFGNIYFCFLAIASLVSSNPLMQSMPFQPCQQQNCPNCQQNPFMNLPIEVPLTFAPQQLPTPQQPNTGCNQCNRPVVTNQNCNLCSRPVLANQGVVNEANHQIVNKVLSNPLVQAIMKNYRYQNPVQNLPGNIKPQVINNYFIIPSDVLLNETKKVKEKNAAVKLKQQTKIQDGRRNNTNQGKRPNQAPQWKPQCIVPERPQNPRVYNPTGQPKPKVQTVPKSKLPLEQKQNARIQNAQEKPVCQKNNKVVTDKINQCAKIGNNEETKISVQKCKDAVKDFFDEYYENEEINKPQTKRSGKDEISRSFETEFQPKTVDQESSIPRQANLKRKPNQTTKNKERSSYSTKMVKNSAEIEKPADLSNQSQKNYIGEPIDFVNAKQLPKESRKTRNPDDAIIRNVKSKYPNMPEKLVRELLFQMKKQIQNNQPQRQINHHNHPYNNFYPIYYNPYYQQPHYPWFPVQQWAGVGNVTANNIPRHPGKKQKSIQNKKPKQIKNQNNSANGNAHDISNDSSKLKMVTEQTIEKTGNENQFETTEKSNTDATTLETLQDTDTPETVEPEKITNEPENTTPYSSSYEGNAYPDSRLQQLGAEDEIPNIDDNGIGWIEDYYPDFSKDSFFDDGFYESHPEYYEEEIQRNERKIPSGEDLDHKYIDKRREMFRKYGRRRLNGNSIIDQKPLNEEEFIPKPIPDFEDNSEEIVFKTPPGLEAPDFKTKKIKEYRDSEYSRPRYFSEDYDYFVFNDRENISNDKKSPAAELKSSTYSYSKIPYDSSSVKPSNEVRNQKEKIKAKIETNYANSKIVRYGNVPDIQSNEDATQESTNTGEEEDIRNKYYATDSDGTSIVMANSYFS